MPTLPAAPPVYMSPQTVASRTPPLYREIAAAHARWETTRAQYQAPAEPETPIAERPLGPNPLGAQWGRLGPDVVFPVAPPRAVNNPNETHDQGATPASRAEVNPPANVPGPDPQLVQFAADLVELRAEIARLKEAQAERMEFDATKLADGRWKIVTR